MRLVFLIHRLDYSGAPKMLAWIANQMAQRNHDVHIISFFSTEKIQLLHKNVKLHNFNIKQSRNRIVRNSGEMITIQYRLQKELKRIKPDVIVSFNISATYIHLGLNKLFGKYKVIFSERSDPYTYHGPISKIRFALMRCANGTVFQTKGARRFFRGKILESSTVIPNPVVRKEKVAFQSHHCDMKRDNRIVSVGRLSLKQKRQDVLLEAFEIVHQKHPELTLHIYGDGQDANQIQALVDKMGLQDCAKLEGITDNVESSIGSARVFVLTSDYEGIPNALIEALAIGVPCVATDCSPGGAAELIQNGENGFLVPCGDALSVADRIIRLVEDEDLSNAFSDAGYEIQEKLSEERIADMWEQYIYEVRTN